MTSPVRFVGTDIGGTLARSDGRISPFTSSVVSKLIDTGIPVAYVTGFGYPTIARIRHTLDPRAFIIAHNGAIIFEKGEAIAEHYLPIDTARGAIGFYLDRGITPLVFTGPHTNYNVYYELSPGDARPEYPGLVQVSDLSSALDRDPIQVSALGPNWLMERVYREAMDAFPDCHVVISKGKDRSWVEVNNPKARKSRALSVLLDRLIIDPSQVMYFGDNMNDADTFRLVGYPVAVANALEEVKPLAKAIALSNDEDGVARFITEHFRL